MKYEAMNAKPCKDLQKLIDSGDYIAEIKFDGYRAICENGKFYSRLGNDLTEKVPHLVMPKNMVLDGELLFGNNSSDVTKILGSKPARAVGLQTIEKVRYVVFDILELNGKDLTELPWRERRSILEKNVKVICPVQAWNNTVVSLTEVHTVINSALHHAEKIGAEGIMLKNVNAEYYPGKRPENVWYKLKKHDTADVKITGFAEGKGKFAGMIGSIEFIDETGRAGACSGMTDEQRQDFTKNRSAYIGKTMEISFMELSKNGYRHPQFKTIRGDK